jgi:hypothetical protein
MSLVQPDHICRGLEGLVAQTNRLQNFTLLSSWERA